MKKEEMAIPISEARLCLNCDNIVQAQICPACLSTKQLFIVQFLGGLENGHMKRFIVTEKGKVKAINIREKEDNGK